jgi:hypothetical protein
MKLDSIIEVLEQERASISVVGRGLTPKEQKRIQQLECGISLLRSALETLNNESTPMQVLSSSSASTLLRDGRYEGGNHEIFIDLRVDEGVCGVISADIFRLGSTGRSYVASLRTSPGSRITTKEGTWTIIGQDEQDNRPTGKLTLHGHNGNADTLIGTLFFESALHGLPSRREIGFVAERASDFLRRIGIELELEEGVEPPAAYRFNNREITIEEALRDAGIDSFTTGLTSRIPRHNSGWDMAQLHALMQDFAQSPLTQRIWELHLLVLSRTEQRGLLGVMFDTTETLPRQGTAVFADEIRSIQGIDHNRKLIQTAVHELGHALNLAHRFERAVGRADSTSFMNYDWRYQGGNRSSEFWSKFAFTFDLDELEFLRHAPLPPLIPGGAAFHAINYWADGNGGYSPYVPEVPLTGYQLSLKPPLSGSVFAFAQPVFLEVELTNLTGQSQNLPSFLLDPKAGFLELLIRRRTGSSSSGFSDTKAFVPFIQRCFEWSTADTANVPQGGSIKGNLNLTYGSGGFTFAEPGSYDVTALLVIFDEVLQRELIVRSETIRIRVATPKTLEEENDALLFFRDDVGLYLALGGSDALPEAVQALDNIVDHRQGKSKKVTEPLVASILRAKGINAGRSYIRFHNGQFERREPQYDVAANLLKSLDRAALTAFDPSTAESTKALADKYQSAAEG